MGSDFVVVIRGFEKFGDEPNEPYSGPVIRGDDFDYTFDCPGIDVAETAVWYCKTVGVDFTNRLTLNGQSGNAVGHIGRSGDSSADARTHMQMINGNILVETGNNLRIEAVNSHNKTRGEGGGGNLDDFVIGEMVIFYKLRSRGIFRRRLTVN